MDKTKISRLLAILIGLGSIFGAWHVYTQPTIKLESQSFLLPHLTNVTITGGPGSLFISSPEYKFTAVVDGEFFPANNSLTVNVHEGSTVQLNYVKKGGKVSATLSPGANLKAIWGFCGEKLPYLILYLVAAAGAFIFLAALTLINLQAANNKKVKISISAPGFVIYLILAVIAGSVFAFIIYASLFPYVTTVNVSQYPNKVVTLNPGMIASISDPVSGTAWSTESEVKLDWPGQQSYLTNQSNPAPNLYTADLTDIPTGTFLNNSDVHVNLQLSSIYPDTYLTASEVLKMGGKIWVLISFMLIIGIAIGIPITMFLFKE